MQSPRSNRDSSHAFRSPAENDAQSSKTSTRPRWVDAARRAEPDRAAPADVIETHYDATSGVQPQDPWTSSMLQSPKPCAMQRPGDIAVPRLSTDLTPGKLLGVALLRPKGEDGVEFVGLAIDASKFSAWDPRRMIFESGIKSACELAAESAPRGRRLASLRDYQAFTEVAEGVIAVGLTQGYYPESAGYAAVHEALKAYIGQQPSDGHAAAAGVLASCSNPGDADKLSGVQIKIHETTKVFLDVIDQTLARGEKLDRLRDQCEELGLNARQFKKTSRAVKRSFQCCKIM